MSFPTSSPLITRILENTARDDIEITTLPFYQEALDSIAALSSEATTPPTVDFSSATRIDTHTHPIPNWFRALEPAAAGRETPSWNVSSHLRFMADHKIKKSVLCISTPQGNAFLTERDVELRKKKTVALVRLLNEFVAELCRLYPERFAWMAITPLPYVDEAVTEVKYALEELGAVGVGILTNHEGNYPGENLFDKLWSYLQKRAEEHGSDGREVVFVHPTEPIIVLDDGRLINSRPSRLRSGLGEFYFETARAISSITANSTVVDFPGIHWRISHGAGAFPDISERFLLGFPKISDAATTVYKKRFWYDTAGPVFPKQVKGLVEGMGVSVGQMVFGTDYPYGIGFWDVDQNIAGLANAEFLVGKEKEDVFWRNSEELWKGKIYR